jgi:hypothetical protein
MHLASVIVPRAVTVDDSSAVEPGFDGYGVIECALGPCILSPTGNR